MKKKLGLVLLSSIVVPALYQGRRFYVYNKMINRYNREHSF